MKKLWLASLVAAGWASFAFGDVKVITPQLAFYPTRNVGRIARIVFEPSEKGSYFVLIRDAKGQLVRLLTTGPKEAGRMSVDWDGKDTLGAVVPEGAYKATLCSGLTWELDKSFGKDGRIGKFSVVRAVDDPEKMEMPLQGEIIGVKVNDAEYYKADDLSVAGPNYAVANGTLQVNPLGGAKKGDKLVVDYYYPAYFNNPWDAAVDDSGSLYVLLHWQEAKMQYPMGKLLKLTPDGKGMDKGFGDNGFLPPFDPAQQILLSPQEKRIYVVGSHESAHQTGVFSMDSGAFLYGVGGWAGGQDKRTTWSPSGAALGKDNIIYIGGGSIYDRSKERFNGFIWSGAPTTRQDYYPPMWGVYWGPSMEGAMDPDMFYRATYGSNICKVQDTNHTLHEVYYTDGIAGSPIGMSLDRKTGLLFSALRTTAGEVALFADDGLSLKEVQRLKDPDLGPTHTVRYKDGALYVVEDGWTLPANASDIINAMKKAGVNPQGKNRLSRYHVAFDKETDLAAIERK